MNGRRIKMVLSQSIAIVSSSSSKEPSKSVRRFPSQTIRLLSLDLFPSSLSPISSSSSRSITTSSQLAESTEIQASKFSDEALSISNAITTSNFTSLAQFGGKLNESLVNEVLKLLKDPQIQLRFFFWAGRQTGYIHVDRSCHILFETLGFEFDHSIRFPHSLFVEMLNDDEDKKIVEKLWNVFILKCCENGLRCEALNELGRLKEFGYRPWKSTYDALLVGFLNDGQLDTAFSLREEMLRSGVGMTRFALSCFTQSLCKVGRCSDAVSLMQEENFEADRRIYTQMISGLCEGGHFEEALGLFERMKLSRSCVPDVVTYKTLLRGCLRKGNLGLGKELVGMMISDGCSPTVSLFESLLKAYFDSGDCAYGYELLKTMKGCGCKPSKVTCNDLLLVLLDADEIDTAILVREEVLDLGIPITRFTLGCFARSFCKVGRHMEAMKMIEERKFKPDTKIYTQMIKGLCEASLFEEAVDSLQRMRSDSCVPDFKTYTTLLQGCLSKENLNLCKRILNLMIADGCSPSVPTFESLIKAYCISGDYMYGYELLKKMSGKSGSFLYNTLIGAICGNKEPPSSDILELAEKAYYEMLDAGIVLNTVNVTNFVRCLCGARKFDRAFTVINEMIKSFSSDTRTYTKVIDSFCKASKMEMAFRLFKLMKENNILPNVYTYTILIDGFSKLGFIQEARKLFGEMIKNGCTPNVVTFTALMHGYLKAQMVSDANYLFEKMISAGFSPNIVTYTVLIDGHCKAGDIEKACQIYSRMKGDETLSDVDMYFRGDGSTTSPNVFTYGALMDGLCKDERVLEARELLNAMSVLGCDPNHIVYTSLINGLCKVGRLDEVHELISEMSESGCTPNAYTYSSLIDKLVKDARLDLASKVFEKMLENSCAPDVVTYTNIIDGLCRVGETEKAYKLLLLMEEKGCQPDVVAYTVVIDAFGKVGNVNMSLTLLVQMITKGCVPDLVTYRVLVKHCYAAGLLDEVHKLLEEMKRTYRPRSAADYGFLIESLSNACKVEKAFEVYRDMERQGYIPDISLFFHLLRGLTKINKWVEALELSHGICHMDIHWHPSGRDI